MALIDSSTLLMLSFSYIRAIILFIMVYILKTILNTLLCYLGIPAFTLPLKNKTPLNCFEEQILISSVKRMLNTLDFGWVFLGNKMSRADIVCGLSFCLQQQIDSRAHLTVERPEQGEASPKRSYHKVSKKQENKVMVLNLRVCEGDQFFMLPFQ